jgi:hypothetical protein
VAVDREGKIAAVRCRAALDLGVEAVFEGVAPGHRLEEAARASKTTGASAAEGVRRRGGGGEAAEKTATGAEAALDERRGAAGRGVVSAGGQRGEGGWVDRVLEEVRREFSGLPVYVGVEEGYVYVKRTAPTDQRQFRKYTDVGGWVLGLTGERRGGSSRWRS